MSTKYFLQFGSKRIDYELIFVDRKTLGITVTPELEVIVKAPLEASIEKVKEKVKKRAPWILKQQSFFLSFYPRTPARRYVSGETHLYMGRQYRLDVKIGKSNSVRYRGRFIEVETKNLKQVKPLVQAWYRAHAKLKFSELAVPLVEQFKVYDVEPSGIYIQEMPKRWGSCTPTGKIILNPELIKAPRACIEYVIIHELCHLVHHHHTQKFFDLQTKHMPDWVKWKERLERVMV
ncbi:MAG: SprT family zinc-dependent metalloprotease [Roseivirga sp.]